MSDIPPPPPGFSLVPEPPPGFRLVKNEPSSGVGIARKAEMFSRGVMDVGAETLGGLPDLVARGMRFAGLPAPEEGFYTNKIKAGMGAAGRALSAPLNAAADAAGVDLGPSAAQGKGEKVAYGAGRGTGNALSIALPAAGVAKMLPAGVPQSVAQTMASSPGLQVAAGATGGGVEAATDSPLAGTAAAVAVPLIAAAGRRIAAPIKPQLTPDETRLAGVAASEGINLSAAQRTGSPALQTFESVMGTLPLTAGPQKAITQNQARQFNRAVLERAGIRSDYASPEVLKQASDRLGREFERVAAATVVNLDDPFLTRMQDVASRYGNKLPSQQREVFKSFLDDILGAGNAMPGAQYQQARSDLTRLAKSYRQNDPATAGALRGMRDALDDAADRSIPESLRGVWDTARSQWAALRVVDSAMKAGQGSAAAAGNIPPGALKQAVANQDPRGFVQGKGQLTDLARVGERFIRDQVPNSGTPGRENMIRLLQGGAAGSGLLSGDPVTALAMPALALGGPRAAQAAYNTAPIQRYLTGQTAPRPANADAKALAAILAGRIKGALPPP